ncbi:MAG: hypothetical protein HY706_12550 [Candidatus Hydrogenedentes bacterium]|nr:hypothetical protein [Candidatus Hydrogenedentota bacterium]
MQAIAIEEYRDAMRDDVCNVCVIFTPHPANPRRCFHETTGKCGLFLHIDRVVEAVSNIHSDSIAPYLEELRRKVCGFCENQNADLVCRVRDSNEPVPSWCVLDAYLNLVVGAIERVQAEHASAVKS